MRTGQGDIQPLFKFNIIGGNNSWMVHLTVVVVVVSIVQFATLFFSNKTEILKKIEKSQFQGITVLKYFSVVRSLLPGANP